MLLYKFLYKNVLVCCIICHTSVDKCMNIRENVREKETEQEEGEIQRATLWLRKSHHSLSTYITYCCLCYGTDILVIVVAVVVVALYFLQCIHSSMTHRTGHLIIHRSFKIDIHINTGTHTHSHTQKHYSKYDSAL